jgi:hypothetical protein
MSLNGSTCRRAADSGRTPEATVSSSLHTPLVPFQLGKEQLLDIGGHPHAAPRGHSAVGCAKSPYEALQLPRPQGDFAHAVGLSDAYRLAQAPAALKAGKASAQSMGIKLDRIFGHL